MCVCVKADFRILCVFSSAGKLFETFTETIVTLPTSCRTSANLLDKCSLQRSCLRQFRSLFFFFSPPGVCPRYLRKQSHNILNFQCPKPSNAILLCSQSISHATKTTVVAGRLRVSIKEASASNILCNKTVLRWEP